MVINRVRIQTYHMMPCVPCVHIHIGQDLVESRVETIFHALEALNYTSFRLVSKTNHTNSIP